MWQLKIGDTFDRRYRILRKIGSGGMSYVFAAEDEELAETVALKIIKPDFAEDDEFVTRFKREVRITRQIRHPNVVQVFEFGRTTLDGTDLYYLTMELLNGKDLGAWLREQKPAALADVLRIGLQLCDALKEAHGAGVIHRDIKPQNIFVEPNDQVKLMDFGISRITSLPSVTQGGKLIGTPRYMSPEQIHGKASPDHRSDIYSLGIVLYELCTRRKPFDGDNTIEIAMKQLQEVPQRPRDLNPRVLAALDRVIMRCLEKEPERRYQTAAELRAALEVILSQPQSPPGAKTVVGIRPPLVDTERADLPATGTAPYPVEKTKPRRPPPRPSPSSSMRTVREAPKPKQSRPFRPAVLSIAAAAIVGLLAFGVYRWLTPSSTEGPSSETPREAVVEQPTAQTDGPVEEPVDPPEIASATTVPAEPVERSRPPTTSTVSRPAPSTVAPKPPPVVPMGELDLTSKPEGATVTIDGESVGTTPWLGELTEGEHRLRLSRPGYSPVEQRIAVSAGETLKQSLQLTPRQRNVEVTISANPGTEIYVDGESAGKIPPNVNLTLSTGRHTIRYVIADYAEHQETVDVLPNRENTFSHRFPLFGSVRIVATPYAQVHLDGKDMGFTPVNVERFPEGAHELTLSREGYETVQETITVRPAEVNRYNYKMVEK
jgi:serine/threonine protein kinase